MNSQLLTVLAPVSAVLIASLLSRWWAKKDHEQTITDLRAVANQAKEIKVNVDGNLSNAIKATEDLKKEVAASVTEIARLGGVVANQATAISDQATAISNLTGAVKQNGERNSHD